MATALIVGSNALASRGGNQQELTMTTVERRLLWLETILHIWIDRLNIFLGKLMCLMGFGN